MLCQGHGQRATQTVQSNPQTNVKTSPGRFNDASSESSGSELSEKGITMQHSTSIGPRASLKAVNIVPSTKTPKPAIVGSSQGGQQAYSLGVEYGYPSVSI